MPAGYPGGAVTAFAGTGDVDTVIVAGRVRKRHGRLVDVDLDAARELATTSRRRLLG